MKSFIKKWEIMIFVLFCQILQAQPLPMLRIGFVQGDFSASVSAEKLCLSVVVDKDNSTSCQTKVFSNEGELLQEVQKKQLEFAIVSELVYSQAKNSRQLAIVLPLYINSVVLVASADSNISRLQNIRRHKIGVLSLTQESEQYILQRLLSIMHTPDLIHFYDSGDQLFDAICNRDVDVILMLVAHPNQLLREITNTCEVVMLPVIDKVVDELVKSHTAIFKIDLPTQYYWRATQGVQTLGTRMLLITHKEMSNDVLDEILARFWVELVETQQNILLNIQAIYQAYEHQKINLIGAGQRFIAKIQLERRYQELLKKNMPR